jgi:hypothetical protein
MFGEHVEVTWKYVFLMTFKTVSLNAMYAIIINDAFSIKLLKIYRKIKAG